MCGDNVICTVVLLSVIVRRIIKVTAKTVKMFISWDAARCDLVEIYCLHHENDNEGCKHLCNL
jgi:hypothetical protein